MGYRRMDTQDLWEIYRRWIAGQTVSHMAAAEERDRKTVREYIAAMKAVGLSPENEPISREEFGHRTAGVLPQKSERGAPMREKLEPHLGELQQLIGRSEDPLVAKNAFLVVRQKCDLQVSYETFKRFARDNRLGERPRRQIIRIELPPGLETQLDYGKVGHMAVPLEQRNRVVWAFCGILSSCRLPFVQFVFSQDQSSFTGSFVDMVEFYDGVTELISIDNLKAAVVRPDLWDPKINRAFADAAAHYQTFVDPCRVSTPTDKGKVERFVPVARQLFRMLRELHPSAGLAELNRPALTWCREEYGRREHGTTGIAPLEAFETEHAALKRLPEQRFVVPLWKRVTVHRGDQFVTFNKMYFSLPPKWRGQTLWACYSAPVLRLYSQESLVRQYVVRPGQKRYWNPDDFPAAVQHMMDGGYPAWLVEQAASYGQSARELISALLSPHAYLNARRARAMLSVMEAHRDKPYFDEVCERARRRSVELPKTLKRMFETAAGSEQFSRSLSISERGTQMIRDITYYLN